MPNACRPASVQGVSSVARRITSDSRREISGPVVSPV